MESTAMNLQPDSGSDRGRIIDMGYDPDFFSSLSPDAQDRILRRHNLTREDIAAEEERRAAAEQQRKAKTADRKRRQFRESCGLAPSMWSQTFDTFEISTDALLQRQAYRNSQHFVNHLPGVKKGLMLFGDTGRGKSHLAAAITIAAIEKEEPIKPYYIDCLQMSIILQKLSESAITDNIMSADLVVFDDIDKALFGRSNQKVQAFMRTIIGTLSSNKKRSILATTQGGPEDYKAELSKPSDEYILSRLLSMFYWQEVDGIDYRPKEAEEQSEWWVS